MTTTPEPTDYVTRLGYVRTEARQVCCAWCGEHMRADGGVMRSHRRNNCLAHREDVRTPGVCDV
jgi:hypothetical protein